MRDISSPLDGIASPFGPQRTKTLTQLLFSANEPGFTFEPWDITTLYQDRAGTTPVTAAGQSVGYRRDKSGRGNHQVAVSDAKRGVYGWMPKTGRRNLLTYTEQFTFAHNSTTDIAYTGSLPTGTLAAREIREVAATNSHLFRIGSPTFNSSYTGALTFKIRVLPQGRTRVQVLPERVGASEWAGSTFNLVNNTATNTVIAGAQTLTSSNVVDAENGWKVITVTYTPTVSITGLLFCLLDDAVSGATAAPSYAGDASKGVAITGMQIGPADTAYQRVVSQYDITEAGVPTCYYVQADGVDDAYVTPTITPGTDKAQVFVGVRKLSDALAMVVESSADFTLNNGTIAFYTFTDFRFGSKGTSSQVALGGPSAPSTCVATGIGDVSGDSAILRLNGAQTNQNTGDQGTGNFLAYPAYIYGRAGTSFPFNGLDFGHAVRFGPNLDAATIARVESLIARNTPEVTL